MNTKITNIISFILLGISVLVFSCKKKVEVDKSKAFVKYFGGIQSDKGVDVIETSDGGYAIAGTRGLDGVNSDIIVIKTNSEGNEEWSRTFGGPYYDEAGAIANMPDGGFVVIGTKGTTQRIWKVDALEATKDSTLMYAVRLDAQGNTIWEKTYAYSNPSVKIGTFGTAISVNNNTNECLLAGMVDSSYVSGSGIFVNLDLFALIVDGNGDRIQPFNPATNTFQPLKPLRYGSSNSNDYTQSVVSTLLSNNEFIISTSTILSGETTPRLVRAILSGVALLQNNAPTKQDWGQTSLIDGQQVAASQNGDYALVGTKTGNGPTTDMYMIKLNGTSLVSPMMNTYGDPGGSETGRCVIASKDGGFLIAGTTNSIAYTEDAEKLNDVLIIKTDASGNQQWNKVFGGRGNDVITKIIQTSRDDGYLLCGTIAFGDDVSNSGASNSITLIKVNSNGELSNIK